MTVGYHASGDWLHEHDDTFDLAASMELVHAAPAAPAVAPPLPPPAVAPPVMVAPPAMVAQPEVVAPPEVRARAPGKVVLSGEHAFVHGGTAVAAALNLWTHAKFSLLPSENDGAGDGGGLIELEFRDVGFTFTWNSARIKDIVSIASPPPSPWSPRPCAPELFRKIAGLVDEHSIPEANNWVSSRAYACLHLYTSIHGSRAGKVVVTSDLLPGSGLGSSAAYCVSLSAALLALSGAVVVNDQQSGWLELKDEELELVKQWAFEGEKIMHGNVPSGVDRTVSAHGNMIKFSSGGQTRLYPGAPIGMLITITKAGRNTKALIDGVTGRASRHADAMQAVLTAVDSISNELSLIIEAPAIDQTSITAKEDAIKELMEMNQGLLRCMGLNHASIETVLETTLQYKLTSKLTGAGGCVLTLLPTLLSSVTVETVITELESSGYQCMKAEVGGKGLQICFK